MKALLIKGKFKGQQVEVSQWCNDWFSVDIDIGNLVIRRKIVSPTSLAFSYYDIEKIRNHDNNGMLFEMFYVAPYGEPNQLLFTFRKK